LSDIIKQELKLNVLSMIMLKDELVRKGAIKYGSFTLTSGKQSNFYVDIKECMTDPDTLKETAELLSANVHSDIVAGVELGAVPLLVAVSMLVHKPYIIIRKEREHGTKSLLIGKTPPGGTVDIIEDVVTTGGSVLRAAKLLSDTGLKTASVICVVDREEGATEALSENNISLISLIRISEIKKP
jgi:orotate phosphoribosyltransferase